jgi:glycosyltransferase involved in cell wall biosynthesis
MKIALVGGPRFGVQQPYAGGLEAAVAGLGTHLGARGHDVTIFAGVGGEPARIAPRVWVVPVAPTHFVPSAHARADVSMPSARFMAEHHAYLSLGLALRHADVDVIHNHSLHHLPPVWDTPIPMVHTLHSPPTGWLEASHAQRARPTDIVVSVSHANATLWNGVVDLVIPNGVDLTQWRWHTGRRDGWVAWSGRIVPEKAPHLAIDAARAVGRPIRLAGPVMDPEYFAREVEPRLGDDADDAVYLGHLDNDGLAEMVGRSSVAAVTPMWDEPYGLVAAEALAVGTPVAAFARGGVPEVVDDTCGVLAMPGDVAGLARAIDQAAELSSRACRERAVAACSLELLVDRYLDLYSSAATLTEAC